MDKEESLKAAWQIEKQFHDWDSEIDDLTWYDLDMQAIFELINGTYSSIGSEALYQRLRNFHFNQTDDLEELIQFIKRIPKSEKRFNFILQVWENMTIILQSSILQMVRRKS
mgnify:CR=1 FL=1